MPSTFSYKIYVRPCSMYSLQKEVMHLDVLRLINEEDYFIFGPSFNMVHDESTIVLFNEETEDSFAKTSDFLQNKYEWHVEVFQDKKEMKDDEEKARIKTMIEKSMWKDGFFDSGIFDDKRYTFSIFKKRSGATFDRYKRVFHPNTDFTNAYEQVSFLSSRFRAKYDYTINQILKVRTHIFRQQIPRIQLSNMSEYGFNKDLLFDELLSFSYSLKLNQTKESEKTFIKEFIRRSNLVAERQEDGTYSFSSVKFNEHETSLFIPVEESDFLKITEDIVSYNAEFIEILKKQYYIKKIMKTTLFIQNENIAFDHPDVFEQIVEETKKTLCTNFQKTLDEAAIQSNYYLKLKTQIFAQSLFPSLIQELKKNLRIKEEDIMVESEDMVNMEKRSYEIIELCNANGIDFLNEESVLKEIKLTQNLQDMYTQQLCTTPSFLNSNHPFSFSVQEYERIELKEDKINYLKHMFAQKTASSLVQFFHFLSLVDADCVSLLKDRLKSYPQFDTFDFTLPQHFLEAKSFALSKMEEARSILLEQSLFLQNEFSKNEDKEVHTLASVQIYLNNSFFNITQKQFQRPSINKEAKKHGGDFFKQYKTMTETMTFLSRHNMQQLDSLSSQYCERIIKKEETMARTRIVI